MATVHATAGASDEIRRLVCERSVPHRVAPEVAAAARAVVDAGGTAVRAIVFFGSRKTRAHPDRFSPWDFLVLVSSYRAFYRSVARAGLLRRHSSIAAGLNVLMPPSVIALHTAHPVDGTTMRIKCPVVSLLHFQRDTSTRRRDHFLAGRLFQSVEIVYAADRGAHEIVIDGLARCVELTYGWVRPSLAPRFDVADYGKALLATSFDAEIRPEARNRPLALWAQQEAAIRPTLATLLSALCSRGELEDLGNGQYSLTRPVIRRERVRSALYFRWSLMRATARWAKHVVTYDDWLDFLVRKAERHSGEAIVLTRRERALPLLFLWPRVFRYLRARGARAVVER